MLEPGHVISGWSVTRVVTEGHLGRVVEAVRSTGEAAVIKAVSPPDVVRRVFGDGVHVPLPSPTDLVERAARQQGDSVILSTGVLEGFAFIVMRPLWGASLAELSPLRAEEELRRLGGLAGRIATLHALGVVHGALHPANVIVAGERFEIGDAALRSAADALVRTVAQAHAAVGWRRPGVEAIVPYAAPEVVRREPPIPVSDVWSLAVIAIRRMTGTPLVDQTLPPLVQMQRVLEGPVLPRALVGHLLEDILGHALSLEPRDRPSAEELEMELSKAV